MQQCPVSSFARCAKDCAKHCRHHAVKPFNKCSLADGAEACVPGYTCTAAGVRANTLCMPTEETVVRAHHSAAFANALKHALEGGGVEVE